MSILYGYMVEKDIAYIIEVSSFARYKGTLIPICRYLCFRIKIKCGRFLIVAFDYLSYWSYLGMKFCLQAQGRWIIHCKVALSLRDIQKFTGRLTLKIKNQNFQSTFDMEVFESALVYPFVVSVTISKKCKVNHMRWNGMNSNYAYVTVLP